MNGDLIAARSLVPFTGDVLARACYDADGNHEGYIIEQADPRVLISDVLLREWTTHPGWPHVEVEMPPYSEDQPDPLTGAIVRLRGLNRTVIYRIGDGSVHGYHFAEWPD